MSDDAEVFETKIVVTRGTGSNDRDKFTTKITAPDLETLTHRVERVREETADWAGEFRQIQPTEGGSLHEDQSSLGGVES